MTSVPPTSSLHADIHAFIQGLQEYPELPTALRERAMELTRRVDAEQTRVSHQTPPAKASEALIYPEGYVNPVWGCEVLDRTLGEMKANGRPKDEVDELYARYAPRILHSIHWMDRMHGNNGGAADIKARLAEIRNKHNARRS